MHRQRKEWIVEPDKAMKVRQSRARSRTKDRVYPTPASHLFPNTTPLLDIEYKSFGSSLSSWQLTY
jgi:hypothetical protein